MEKEETRNWKTIKQEYGPGLKLFQVRFDYVINPRNNQEGRMVILEGADSANVVALTQARRLLFVRQYRFGISDYTLELPGGIVDPGEGHKVAAMRELEEETGYGGGRWSYLGSIPSNPVFMNSYIHHWLAEEVEEHAIQQLDAEEEVQVVSLSLEQARRMLYQGEFLHPHTVNALLRFFTYWPNKETDG
ncbi:MAG: NUDIX hydrolase [Phaeodactylibacter sp.]|nr:NUDIX hydrolase [Phaeodactylibacter sp.]MCB9276413.1 NUDIX hydrolase [Lewinellaceae bacterium]